MSKIVPEKINLKERTNIEPFKRNYWQIPALLHHSFDDFLFGLIMYQADYHVKEKNTDNIKDGEQFLSEKELKRIKDNYLAWSKYDIKTINRHLQVIFESGVLFYNIKKQRYQLRNNYDEENKELFYLIRDKTLYRLLLEGQPQLIKIYCYLTFQADNFSKINRHFNFTIPKLMKVLGYKTPKNETARKEIKDALAALCRMGAINLYREWLPEKQYLIPYYVIDKAYFLPDLFQPMDENEIQYLFYTLTAILKKDKPIDEPIVEDDD